MAMPSMHRLKIVQQENAHQQIVLKIARRKTSHCNSFKHVCTSLQGSGTNVTALNAFSRKYETVMLRLITDLRILF